MRCSKVRALVARGVGAALFFCLSCILGVTASAAAQQSVAAMQLNGGQMQLGDGLTFVQRKLTASPTAALEIWIRCPANGYGSSRPGIARLTALALLEQKSAGVTLREHTRQAGAQIGVSVYHEGTEIAILTPGYMASSMLDELLGAVLHPHIDRSAYLAARQRLAAQQVASLEMADQLLRDSLFAHIFTSGPFHEPTYGNAQTLAGLTLEDVNGFVARAYVPSSEIVVATGSLDLSDVSRRVNSFAPPPASGQSMPESAVAPPSASAITLQSSQAASGGVAVGWIGPSVADEQAATAMDFLSDYLTHPAAGVVTKAVDEADPSAKFYGQFITLRPPGVFFMSVTSGKLNPAVALQTIRQSTKKALSSELSKPDFARAVDAFRTHLLRQMQTPQQVADNYGWYFTQGAPAYSPSATDAALAGEYFAQVQRLTSAYVYAVAKRYLLSDPVVIMLPRSQLHTAVGP